ncbi:MAG: S8 family serine peptidase [Clostridia bacterium]|nr:S8 family serine peptidase [Clostridia bacterium]
MKRKYRMFIKSVVAIAVVSVMVFNAVGASPLPQFQEVQLTENGVCPEKVSPELWAQLTASAGTGAQTMSQTTASVTAEIVFEDAVDYDTIEQEALSRMDPEQRALVICALSEVDDESVGEEDETALDAAIEQYRLMKRIVAKERYVVLNAQYMAENDLSSDNAYVGKYSSVVSLPITQSQVVDLAASDEVVYIDVIRNGEDQMEVSIPTINADIVRDTRGYTGSGIKIGMIETGVPNVGDPSLSSISSRIHIHPGSVSYVKPHATAVAVIMVGQQTSSYVKGIAPNASLYCASSQIDGGYRAAIEWLIEQGVHVINASWGLNVYSNGTGVSTYEDDANWFEHIAFHDIHYVAASGNTGNGGVLVTSMPYNIITVGNVDDKNTLTLNDDTLANDSSYHPLTTGLMKPDICAPGTAIHTTTQQGSGTSLSAPHVSATIALLCQQRTILKTRQDLVKAILTCATSQDCGLHFTPNNPDYKKYGAGLLDADAARWVTHSYRYNYGSLNSTTTSKTYTVNVTSNDTYLRVSMAYLRTAKFAQSVAHAGNVTPSAIYDLDLFITGPTGITASSISLPSRSNIEIIQIDPDDYGGPGTYTIEVCAMESLPENVYFGVAWR